MRRSVVATLLGLSLAGVVAAAEPDYSNREIRQASSLTRKASKHLESGSLDKARNFYQKAIDVVAEFPDAHVGLGHVAMRERRFDEALASFRRAKDGYVSMNHYMMIARRENFDRARQQLVPLRAEYARLEQAIATAQVTDAATRMQMARIEREILRLENVPEPQDASAFSLPPRIHFFIGNALMNLGRQDEAVAAWEECIRDNPAFPLVYNNLAVAYWKEGRISEARAALARAEDLGLAVNPQFKAALRRQPSDDETLTDAAQR